MAALNSPWRVCTHFEKSYFSCKFASGPTVRYPITVSFYSWCPNAGNADSRGQRRVNIQTTRLWSLRPLLGLRPMRSTGGS
jgi:hypothetical protein